jgi:hypothetical protein
LSLQACQLLCHQRQLCQLELPWSASVVSNDSEAEPLHIPQQEEMLHAKDAVTWTLSFITRWNFAE